MSGFNATEHPRDEGGRFSTKPLAAGEQVDLSMVPAVRQGFDFTADNGVAFRAKIIPAGGSYGRTGSLVNDGCPMVEFYDTRRADNLDNPHGQFVSRYYVDTILGEDDYGTGEGGLDLYGGEPDWQIDADSMKEVRSWLRFAKNPEAPGVHAQSSEINGLEFSSSSQRGVCENCGDLADGLDADGWCPDCNESVDPDGEPRISCACGMGWADEPGHGDAHNQAEGPTRCADCGGIYIAPGACTHGQGIS